MHIEGEDSEERESFFFSSSPFFSSSFHHGDDGLPTDGLSLRNGKSISCRLGMTPLRRI